MLDKFYSHNWTNLDGNPSGGCCGGQGFTISWQRGPLGREGDHIEPNGAFVETVLAAVGDRIQFYQDSKFQCEENALALRYINQALAVLDSRTKDREDRGVEGTHTE